MLILSVAGSMGLLPGIGIIFNDYIYKSGLISQLYAADKDKIFQGL